ncbi:MAG: hypothetical protein E7328_02550 [Clostridiales bacterium]|nr:hypothetical protein [Clostridiales bacterium]
MNRSQAMEQIKVRHERAEYHAAQRRKELADGDDALKALYAERSRAWSNAFFGIQSGSARPDAEKLLQYGARIEERMQQLLKEKGLSAEYLLPQYTCKICSDTGIRPDGSCCSCLCELMMEGRPSGVDGLTTFASYDESRIPEGKQRKDTAHMCNLLKEYAKEFTGHGSNLFLRGAAGLGKSFLLGCTAAAINEKGYSVLYLTAYEMLERFRQKHLKGEDTITPMVDVDFLVIDDLGTEPILNNITIEYLFAVLNARSRKEAPYAVATNLTSDQLQAQYGERVFSRLMDRAKLFLFQGKDLRIHAVRSQGN